MTIILSLTPLPLSLPKARNKLCLKQSILVSGIAYIAVLQDKLLARLINLKNFFKEQILRGGGNFGTPYIINYIACY